MLLTIKENKSIFKQNIYEKYISDTYGIETNYSDFKILKSYLYSKLTNIFDNSLEGRIIQNLDVVNFSLQPININYNNITNIINGAAHYTHLQTNPSSVWYVTHNLGYNPVVAIYDENGVEMEGLVDIDINNTSLRILFNTPVLGKAECSP